MWTPTQDGNPIVRCFQKVKKKSGRQEVNFDDQYLDGWSSQKHRAFSNTTQKCWILNQVYQTYIIKQKIVLFVRKYDVPIFKRYQNSLFWLNVTENEWTSDPTSNNNNLWCFLILKKRKWVVGHLLKFLIIDHELVYQMMTQPPSCANIIQ
jgi:hypothetical protein